MPLLELWRWTLTDPVSGRRFITRHRMTEADARATDPAATRLPGSLERRAVPDATDAVAPSRWQRSAPTAPPTARTGMDSDVFKTLDCRK